MLPNKTVLTALAIFFVVAVFIFLSARVYYSNQAFKIVKESKNSAADTAALVVSSTRITFGTLKGKISASEGETYKNAAISIYSKTSGEKIGETSVTSGGLYQIPLAEGQYKVSVSNSGAGAGDVAPREADIAGGKTAVVDFSYGR